MSTVKVYHCTATISHGSDIPTNDVDWEIVPLLKQRRLKLWKVCRLIRASTQLEKDLATSTAIHLNARCLPPRTELWHVRYGIELDKLKDAFDELDKLNCKFD